MQLDEEGYSTPKNIATLGDRSQAYLKFLRL